MWQKFEEKSIVAVRVCEIEESGRLVDENLVSSNG
jgi:hypothetical protein